MYYPTYTSIINRILEPLKNTVLTKKCFTSLTDRGPDRSRLYYKLP